MPKKETKTVTTLLTVAIIIAIILAGYFIFGNTKDISEVKNLDNVGKKVRVSGEVQAAVKLGQLSGYTLKDDSGTIAVSSDKLPKEGDEVTVSGVLMKDTLLGYYIKAN